MCRLLCQAHPDTILLVLLGRVECHVCKDRKYGDDDKLQEYFDAWCTMTGIGEYSNSLVFKDEMVSGASCTGLKNLLSCEAHNELMINSMKIVFEKRYEEAKKYVPYIKKLQNINL